MFVVEIVVPKTNYAISFGLKPTGPSFVSFTKVIASVLRAIDFDDQARRHAGEVRYIRAYRHLPAKMRTRYREPAELTPQQILRASRSFAQSLGGAATKDAD